MGNINELLRLTVAYHGHSSLGSLPESCEPLILLLCVLPGEAASLVLEVA